MHHFIIEYSIAVGVIAYIIAKTRIIEPLRAIPIKRNWHKLAELLHCPFCMNVWLSIIFLGKDLTVAHACAIIFISTFVVSTICIMVETIERHHS